MNHKESKSWDTQSTGTPLKFIKLIIFHLIIGAYKCQKIFSTFVCVEVSRPSQPNGVMSSAVSLPNHTFTGQFVCVEVLWPSQPKGSCGVRSVFFFFFFFDLGFTALSRIFHLYRADRSSKVGENRSTRRKTT